jgi:hypothetical protein
MTDTDGRKEALGKLFDQACEKLSLGSSLDDVSDIVTPEMIQLSELMLKHYTGIIDRWLQQQEADRQYEFKKHGGNDPHDHLIVDGWVACPYCKFTAELKPEVFERDKDRD